MSHSEVFYFTSNSAFNTVTLNKHDNKVQSIKITNGRAALDAQPHSDIFIGLDDKYRNINELKRLHKAIGDLLNGTTVPVKYKDSLLFKIKTRVSTVRYLHEYLSPLEICVVEFKGESEVAYIGEYIELLTKRDHVFLSKDPGDEGQTYEVIDMSIGKKIVEYFKSVMGKEVSRCYFTSNATLLNYLKANLIN